MFNIQSAMWRTGTDMVPLCIYCVYYLYIYIYIVIYTVYFWLELHGKCRARYVTSFDFHFMSLELRWKLSGLFHYVLHWVSRAWGPLTCNIQIIRWVEKLEMVQVHFTLGFEGLGIKETQMGERITWRPTWHQLDSIMWSTRYCIRPTKRGGFNTRVGVVASNWIVVGSWNIMSSWWGRGLPAILDC